MYYFDIKLYDRKITFFYKKAKDYNSESIKKWRERINVYLRNKNDGTYIKEKDFIRIFNMKEVTRIKLKEEKITIYKNNLYLLYKIESKEKINMDFNPRDKLLTREFFINKKRIKYAILKN